MSDKAASQAQGSSSPLAQAQRTVKSAVYTPADQRTDDRQDVVIGGVTYVRWNECDHLALMSQTAHFKVGERGVCRACEREASGKAVA